MKDLVVEVERCDMKPKPASLLVDKDLWEEEKKDMVIETAVGKHKLPYADEFRNLKHLFSRDGRKQISLQEKCRAPKCLVEGREDIPMQKCTVENQVPKSD